MAFRVSPHWLKTGGAAVAGIATLLIGHHLLLPPTLTPVAMLTTPIPAFSPINTADLTWVAMANPPEGIITQTNENLLTTLVPTVALPAGSTIPAGVLGNAAQSTALRAGEIPWMVPVSGPIATYMQLAERVSVWATAVGSATPTEIATGVRVVGLYSSTGVAINPSAVSTTPPGTIALAVPQQDYATLAALSGPTVEPNATTKAFTLMVGGTPTSLPSFGISGGGSGAGTPLGHSSSSTAPSSSTSHSRTSLHAHTVTPATGATKIPSRSHAIARAGASGPSRTSKHFPTSAPS